MPSLLTMLNEETWTQGAYARDRFGRAEDVNSPEACQFCLIGAAYKLYGDVDAPVIRKIRDILGTFVPYWQDRPGRTFEEVREVILKAEAMLETAPEHKET